MFKWHVYVDMTWPAAPPPYEYKLITYDGLNTWGASDQDLIEKFAPGGEYELKVWLAQYDGAPYTLCGPDDKPYTYRSLFTTDSAGSSAYDPSSYSHGPSMYWVVRIEYKHAWSPKFFSMNAEDRNHGNNIVGIQVNAYSDEFSTRTFSQTFSENTGTAKRPHMLSQAWPVTIPATRWFEIKHVGSLRGTGYWRHFHLTS